MPTPPITRIVLTGFMGSGKSTVGPLLAARLGWQFADLDTEIERQSSLSVPAIFASHGEDHFRTLETATLAQLLAQTYLVLGLGGGAVESPQNRSALAAPQTAIVYLEAPLDTLLARCRTQDEAAGVATRPLLTEAASRFAGRRSLYEQLAHHTIPTAALPPAEVASLILAALTPISVAHSNLSS